MSYYVIIRGPAGAGKSTISRLLAARIGATAVHLDKVLEEAGLDYVEGEKWIPRQRFLKAEGIIIPKARKELEDGRNVVFDGNFYHREQIEDTIGSLNFPHEVFTLKADLEECARRDESREKPLGREGVEAVHRLVSAFDYGNAIETKGKAPDEVVEEIISVLNSVFN
jgi:predicted kinase